MTTVRHAAGGSDGQGPQEHPDVPLVLLGHSMGSFAVQQYLFSTTAARCEHCYMGERLDRALKMPLPRIIETLATWRRLGGSKLTILGGEPSLHRTIARRSGRPVNSATSTSSLPPTLKRGRCANSVPSNLLISRMYRSAWTAAAWPHMTPSGAQEPSI